jgi:hypothetical protein
MMTFDQCLTELVQKRLITYETAMSSSTTPDDFALYFRGVAGSSVQVQPGQAPPPAPTAQPKAQAAAEPTLELDRPGRR